MTAEDIGIAPLATGFADWDDLLALIRRAFASMEGRIDPPSSVHALTPAKLERKAGTETVLLAREQSSGRFVGCLFVEERADHLYLGKLAVEPALQGRGIGRRLIEAAENLARGRSLPVLELQTRVELFGNQRAFARLGFAEVGRTAHPGFDHPTSVTMRKHLA